MGGVFSPPFLSLSFFNAKKLRKNLEVQKKFVPLHCQNKTITTKHNGKWKTKLQRETESS